MSETVQETHIYSTLTRLMKFFIHKRNEKLEALETVTSFFIFLIYYISTIISFFLIYCIAFFGAINYFSHLCELLAMRKP